MSLILTECTTIQSGHPFRGSIAEKPGSGIKVIQIKDASGDNGIQWSQLIEAEPVTQKTPHFLQKNDILFAARNSRHYAVLVNQASEPTLCSPHFYILRTRSEQLLPAFLTWQLNQPLLQRYFNQLAEGSTTKSINRSNLANAKIALPPLAAQQQITQLHHNLQAQKRVYQQLIQNTDKFMHSIGTKMINDHTHSSGKA